MKTSPLSPKRSYVPPSLLLACWDLTSTTACLAPCTHNRRYPCINVQLEAGGRILHQSYPSLTAELPRAVPKRAKGVDRNNNEMQEAAEAGISPIDSRHKLHSSLLCISLSLSLEGSHR